MLSLFHKPSKTTENFLPGFLPSKKGRQVDQMTQNPIHNKHNTFKIYLNKLSNFDKKKLSVSIQLNS